MNNDRLACAAVLVLVAGSQLAPARGAALEEKAFSKPDLYVSTTNADARTLMEGLPNRAAWSRFFEKHGSETPVFVDPRSGTATSMILRVPLIPGSGMGNRLGLKEVGRKLARPVERLEAGVVGDLVRDFIVTNREVIGIDVTQLGPAIAAQVTDELWQVSVPQVVGGIPVRDGRIAATLSHGNLVLLGTEKWANVTLDTKPGVSAEAALTAAFEHLGGKGCRDKLWKEPTLEIVPFASAGFDSANVAETTIGGGYGHRLAWVFGFQRGDELGHWEMLVDAHDGEVLALRDTNLRESKRISGGVYPATSTGVCPSSDRCGTLQSGWTMPFADTGLPPPNQYANDAGLFDFPASGTVTTTLNGRYVQVLDSCGATLEASEAGNLDLGGFTGQHDCASTGSAGNTAAARTAFYELNKMIELARGWLPTNAWLDGKLTAHVNFTAVGNDNCGAFYSTVDGRAAFLKGVPGECLNGAEVATIVAHEWGHALDDHDAIGAMSVSSEAYGDIAAAYRAQVSCLYYGYLGASNQGCGPTSDGTGMNRDESYQPGIAHCDLDCSGKRDVDWDRHADHAPDTPQNFSCVLCGSPGGSPCGGEVHCDARPVAQAAWDLASRDLQAPPFGLSRTDAFITASRIFFQGSGNIGLWHACNCLAGTSDGCGATNGYMQWLAADDDNGNLQDGTPHMTALHAAFDRHRLACNTPLPQNGGCTGAPAAAPTLVATPGGNRVDLTWSAVAGASRYRVLRTEGHAGCDMGKAVIAETTVPSYADTELANGRTYDYVVHAVGASGSCFGPSSACQSATPVQCAGSVSLPRHRFDCSDTLDITLDDWDLSGAGSHAVSVTSTTETSPETAFLTESPAGSGRFTGTLSTTGEPASSGDGSISVVHGDTIRVGYLDASPCGAPGVLVERNAQVDCQGPVITNLRVTDIRGTRAEIRWDTEEPADSRVVYGPSVPPGHVSEPDSDLVTSHLVLLEDLAECVEQFFSVGSSDRLGNPSVDDNGGSYFSFETVPETKPIFTSPEPPMPIPVGPFTGALATIEVTDVDVVVDVNVKVKIVHRANEDLVLYLIAPDHTTVELSNRNGYGEGYDDTIFDDEASVAISDAEWPFVGSFRPDEPLSAFDGKIATGVWTLRVSDDTGYVGTGTLEKFEMELAYPPRACGPSLGLDSRTLSDACTGSGAGGDNGIVEPGETLQIAVRAVNEDTVSATGVSATLSSFTPGVFVTSASSTYPDLAPGASAPADAPYTVYVDSGVACGTSIVLRLDGACNEGDWSDVFTLRAGEPDPVTTAYFNNTPKLIPDLTTIRSFIVVADPGIVEDVDVGLSIAHTSPTDLDIFLVGRDGIRVELSTDNGGSVTPNYTDTVFDDEAATPITAGNAPFTGSYRPEAPLSLLDGTLATSTWTLEVTDDRQNIPGTLLRWSLSIRRLADHSCEVCTLAEPPTEVLSLAWGGTGKDTLDWSATARATTYKLHRGVAADLPALLDAGADSCERMASTLLSSGPILTESPAQGSFFWFLVRAENAFGAGPTGDATTGARVLDAGAVCP